MQRMGRVDRKLPAAIDGLSDSRLVRSAIRDGSSLIVQAVTA
jgi:hypothetical protein